MMSFVKRNTPLVRTFLILFVLLLTAGGMLASFERKSGAMPLDSAEWQWAPAGTFEDKAPPAAGWQPYTEPVDISRKFYWLRIPLPSGNWKDPVLFMLRLGGNRVMADGVTLYENDPYEKGIRVNSGFYWHMTPLPLQMPGHVDLLLRNGLLNTQDPQIEIGEKASIVNRILHRDLDNLIIGSLLIFSCFVSLGLYASQRDKLYLYFALLAFAGGYASLVGNQLIKFIWSNPWVSFLQETAMPWATFAVMGALEQVFPEINRRTVKALRRFVLAFCLAATWASFAGVYFYTFWISYLYTPVFLVVLVVSYWTIWKAYRIRRDLESIWVMAGFSSLVAIACVHVVRYWLPPSVYQSANGIKEYLSNLPEDLIYLGLFAFVICLIRVIVYRYTKMNRDLTEFNRSLEQLVEKRTLEIRASNRQLEAANERLAASHRESAEAIAESMMLEERHRITGAIHDAVGHTLSAAIVQLDEARRLLPLDRPQTEEKIEASQALARRGLEDIRQSVRLMREDTGHYDLNGAIGALIRETEQSSGCVIDYAIGHMPDTLSILQKRILFQALQEGLAAGLKSGKKQIFRFELSSDPEAVRFQLSIYRPPAPGENIGLRLNAVSERVARLGGELRFVVSSEGAVLSLSMPA